MNFPGGGLSRPGLRGFFLRDIFACHRPLIGITVTLSGSIPVTSQAAITLRVV